MAIEALYRPKGYWPAHARIHVTMPLKGLSAGRGLAYDDSLALSTATGARNISTVDNTTHRMTVTSDDKVVRTMPVSLGFGGSPHLPRHEGGDGQGRGCAGPRRQRPDGAVRMTSNDQGDRDDLLVPWSVRVTNSGEYVHAASWNTGNISSRNTSHGCTNLDVGDAKWFYRFPRSATSCSTRTRPAPRCRPGTAGGWWNLPWSVWSKGGLLLNH